MKTEKIKESILGGRTSLGIELGSTRIKGILVDENNEVIASGGYSWENKLENGIWTYHLNDVWTGMRNGHFRHDARISCVRQRGQTVSRFQNMAKHRHRALGG